MQKRHNHGAPKGMPMPKKGTAYWKRNNHRGWSYNPTKGWRKA